MEFKEFKDLLFKVAKEKGFEECEIYYTDRDSLNIVVYNGDVDKYNLNKTFGLSFRGKFNGKMGYSFTEVLDEESVNILVENAIEAAKSIESNDEQFIFEGSSKYEEVVSYSKELENINPEELISLALAMESESRAYSDKVINIGGCSIGYGNYNYGIYNTKGLELTNKGNLLTAYVVPIIQENNEKFDGCGYVTATSVKEVNPKELAKYGVEEALSRIGGKSIPSNSYKTLINNEAMVSLLSAFSGIFSADAAQKGLSLLKDKEGSIIASDKITLVDNPLLDKGLASTPFDDEGVATFKKDIIAKGELVTLLHNLKTANKAGVETTGNGFKSSYGSPVSIAPTNLYIEKGEKELEELMEYVGDGLMVTEFSGLHSGANSITGDFSLAAKGFYIEGGKKSYPVEQITVAGNFFQLLKDVEAVGSDLKFPMSSIGCPSIVIKELNIAGN